MIANIRMTYTYDVYYHNDSSRSTQILPSNKQEEIEYLDIDLNCTCMPMSFLHLLGWVMTNSIRQGPLSGSLDLPLESQTTLHAHHIPSCFPNLVTI